MRHKTLCVAALAALAATVFGAPAAAQEYPAKMIRFVVPFPPGGATDILARAVANQMSKSLGQNVVIDNRTGANTLIGAEIVYRAPADGHTLLFIAPSFSINPLIKSKMPYDTLKDFSSVARVGNSTLSISVHPSVPAKNIKELLALARARPGELTFASSSIIGNQRLAGEMFFREVAKVNITNIPYNGGAPASNAVMGGHTTILVSNVSEAQQQISAGRLRGIAVMSLARTEQLPNVPTLAESGYPGFEAANWYGAMIRSAVPRPIIEKLSTEISKALQTPDIRDGIGKSGLVPAYLNPEQFDAYIRSEMQRFARIVQTLNLRMD